MLFFDFFTRQRTVCMLKYSPCRGYKKIGTLKYARYASLRAISPLANIPTPRASHSELSELRVGIATVDSTSKLVQPRRKKLCKYDATACVILLKDISPCGECCEADSLASRQPSHISILSSFHSEGYRSGHNEAVLKICSREFLQMSKIPCYT